MRQSECLVRETVLRDLNKCLLLLHPQVLHRGGFPSANWQGVILSVSCKNSEKSKLTFLEGKSCFEGNPIR